MSRALTSYGENTFETGYFSLAAKKASSTWIIDSRASHHMCNGSHNRFRTYSCLSQPIDIRLGDNTVVQATHKGLVQVQNQWINTLHLPTFRYSLLSVGDLDIYGDHTSFKTGRYLITDPTNQKVIITGQKNGMLYELNTSCCAPNSILVALVTSEGKKKLSITESRIWHKRLGHLGDAAIKSIINGCVDDGSTCEVERVYPSRART